MNTAALDKHLAWLLAHKRPKVVVLLDTMVSSRPQQAPRAFEINRHNFTGKRLYGWLGHWKFLVTNSCPLTVNHASKHGVPDREWVRENLAQLAPFDLLLVCGKIAAQTWGMAQTWGKDWRARVIIMPHPAARTWTKAALDRAGSLIRDSKLDLEMYIRDGRLVVEELVPF